VYARPTTFVGQGAIAHASWWRFGVHGERRRWDVWMLGDFHGLDGPQFPVEHRLDGKSGGRTLELREGRLLFKDI
jgi:hypothetical protein